MSEMIDRSRRALLGLAMGDAISWTAMFQRSLLLPPWTRRIRREMDAQNETTGSLRHPMPFALNRDAAPLEPGPAAASEWAAFLMERLLARDGRLDDKSVLEDWRTLAAGEGEIRGPISVLSALANLRAGLLPPACGHDNPHYFDDAAMIRAVPLAVLAAGDPRTASTLAAAEGAVTNDEEGLEGARAVAAGLAAAIASGDGTASLAAALSVLSENGWSARLAERALEIATRASTPWAALPELTRAIVNREYSFGGAAPEVLALLVAVVRLSGGDVPAALGLATAIPKAAESLPALAGAWCAALAGDDAFLEGWDTPLASLRGIALPDLAGSDYRALCGRFTALAGTAGKPRKPHESDG